MDILNRRIYIFIFGLCISFLFFSRLLRIITLPQPNVVACTDCNSVMNELHDFRRDIRKPSLIPVTNKEIKRKLAATSKHPFSNRTTFVLEPQYMCPETKPLLLVVLIHSSPYNFERRESIRRTWMNSFYYTEHFVRLFLFGTVNNTLLQTYIKKEHRYYSDILQGSFSDSYYNLTFNTMTGLQWVQKRCSHAQVVVKVDDDIIIDMFTFLPKYIFSFASKSNHVLCFYKRRMILRKSSSKWYIEKNQLKGKTFFPPYCEGKLVMMTKDVVSKLYNFAFETDFFWIEDVYFYGFVMNKISSLNIIPLRWYLDLQLNGNVARDCLLQKKTNCSYYAAGVSSENNLNELWSLYIQRSNFKSPKSH